jgi:hypothetical protein
VVGDRGYRGLAALAARKQITLDIKAPPKGTTKFMPLAPLYRVEHAFARLGRWRRLSRCYEGPRPVPARGSKSPPSPISSRASESSRPEALTAPSMATREPT